MDTNSNNKNKGLGAPKAPVTHITAAKLRYHREIAAVEGCAAISANSAPFKSSCYRLVHKEHRDEDFIPVAKVSPARLSKQSAKNCCLMWSLSLYETLDQLKAKFATAETHAVKLRKRAGSYGARLEITANDGFRSVENLTGHFSFFEFDTFDSKLAVKERVPLVEQTPTEDL